jgi:hypothetical protein
MTNFNFSMPSKKFTDLSVCEFFVFSMARTTPNSAKPKLDEFAVFLSSLKRWFAAIDNPVFL